MRQKLAAVILVASLLAFPQEPSIKVQTNVVVAPTVVFDKRGNIVNGLGQHEFVVYDNDKPQEFKVDIAFQPIDVVVLLQADAATEDVLPKVKKMAPLLEHLVVGEQGTVAVIAFDHRIRVMQDFTSDGNKIRTALEKINAGSSTSRQVDAVSDAVRMLSHRAKDRRRVILLISETRDKGSEGKLRDSLLLAELNNVIVYTVNMSRFLNTLTAKTPVPRPSHIPPEARHMPAGGTATPNEVMQNSGWGSNTVPAFVEVFRQAKAIFVSNPAEVFTKYTGGREFNFVTQKSLEEAITKIGEELHSQYLISYSPSNKLEGGWHTIVVKVRRPDLEVRTRNGYWLAGVPQ
ncbi:MAG TPA: VWA domain-containing protein [Bryobacteraceae bacterium]|nr:VWA domain-containing protein [Bryobacteraceae bacterium]